MEVCSDVKTNGLYARSDELCFEMSVVGSGPGEVRVFRIAAWVIEARAIRLSRKGSMSVSGQSTAVVQIVQYVLSRCDPEWETLPTKSECVFW